MVHVFCECEKVTPIWNELQDLINDKLQTDYNFDKFELMFGVTSDKFLSFLFLCCKFYIYRCRFQEVIPNFSAFKKIILVKRKVEYDIAYKKGKLSSYFKKRSFDF